MDDYKVSGPFGQDQDEVTDHPAIRNRLTCYYSSDQPSGYRSDELPSEGSSPRNSVRDNRRKLRPSHSPRQSQHKIILGSISPSVSSPSNQSGWSILDANAFECDWDLPNLLIELLGVHSGSSQSGYPTAPMDVIDIEKGLFDTLTLTRSESSVKVSTCRDYVGEMYGDEGIRLLRHIVRALVTDDGTSDDNDMVIKIRPLCLYVLLQPSLGHLWDLLLWVCLTFRRQVLGNVCLSTGIIDGTKVTLKELTQLDRPKSTYCWPRLFKTAVIASDPRIQFRDGFFLELNFYLMLQLAAVEYPVTVNSGLVLMGYSTALVPVQKVDHESILWHLETANDDSQLKTKDLLAVQGKWMMKAKLKHLRTKTVLLGWCPEAVAQLGTRNVNSAVGWTDARPRQTTWSFTGANLQLLATTVSPFQVGVGASLAFERRINTVRFSPEGNYLKCLNNSVTEQIILYDVSESRAWLVPLIIVFHQMLLAYHERIPDGESKGTVPIMEVPFVEADQSLRLLQGSGSWVVEGSGNDQLTVRELILGFSVNMAKAHLRAPRRSSIFGYEFMDIVTDSPNSELKKTRIDKPGLAWSSLLNEISCLFCSKLGDAIVGLKSRDIQSPCNRLPEGFDWLATTIRSLDILHHRHGGRPMCAVRRLASGQYWSLTGSPFQNCHHGNGSHVSCWDTNSLLQEIRDARMPKQERERTEGLPNGAVVFGRRRRMLFFTMRSSDPKVEEAVPGQVIERSAPILMFRAISHQQHDISRSVSFETLTED
ncbi:hypothetical protein ABOM_009070 [Aspergillus bombycis]|uniref:Uncharacterized protein n=1 Tax=Aspergillus bombycis TaxID=109264 RepID=A0A1F7ZS00_9EURO|nr:hypothetical protein ABOM_009070 [Aspergillus bombycis]OGM42240.1 hypothetical protein ABOM_009070 [Aspergillus bombycis]